MLPHGGARGRRWRTFLHRIRRGRKQGRDVARLGKAALGPPSHKAACARKPDELSEPPRFSTRNGLAERSNAVVSAALVIIGGSGAFPRLGDQPLFEHALDGAVERPGAELEISA